MVAIQQRPFVPHPLQHLAAQSMAPPSKAPTDAEKLQAAKLQTLDAETLGKLQSSFFDTAAGSSGKLPAAATLAAFFAQSPNVALGNNFAHLNGAYFNGEKEVHIQASALDKTEHEASNPPPKEASPETKSAAPKPSHRNYSRTPGLFSSPAADKAAEALRQSQQQTQNFMANQLGQSFATGNMVDFLGPNACFEDVLAEAMMRIAEKSEKETMEQIRVVERGESGLNNFLTNRARDLGGLAGGAIGGYFGGAGGAAIGQEIGDRLVGNAASQYGGSRQVQFERLKMGIQKNAELMSAISNILATMHQTKKNTIGNIRG